MFSSIQAVLAVSSIPEESMVSGIVGVAMSSNFPGNRPMFGGKAFPRPQLLTADQKLKIKPIFFSVYDSTKLSADDAQSKLKSIRDAGRGPSPSLLALKPLRALLNSYTLATLSSRQKGKPVSKPSQSGQINSGGVIDLGA